MKAPVLARDGTSSGQVDLADAAFAVDAKPHLLHEAVRAELNARRAGTRAAKSRGMVSGGRAKPWRQKGTGRARAGTIRAPQFTGGGVAFPPSPRSFALKMNRKARRAALAGALSAHAARGSLGLVSGEWDAPSTKAAEALVEAWGATRPLVVVADESEESLLKSFRNLERVAVTVPGELGVAEVVWARSLLVTEAALPLVQARVEA